MEAAAAVPDGNLVAVDRQDGQVAVDWDRVGLAAVD